MKRYCKQSAVFADKNLSKYQCGFGKGYVAGMERCGYNKKAFGALLTDLFKVFDLLSRELIIAKLNAYGFSFLH